MRRLVAALVKKFMIAVAAVDLEKLTGRDLASRSGGAAAPPSDTHLAERSRSDTKVFGDVQQARCCATQLLRNLRTCAFWATDEPMEQGDWVMWCPATRDLLRQTDL